MIPNKEDSAVYIGGKQYTRDFILNQAGSIGRTIVADAGYLLEDLEHDENLYVRNAAQVQLVKRKYPPEQWKDKIFSFGKGFTKEYVMSQFNWMGRLMAAKEGCFLNDFIHDEHKSVREEAKSQLRKIQG